MGQTQMLGLPAMFFLDRFKDFRTRVRRYDGKTKHYSQVGNYQHSMLPGHMKKPGTPYVKKIKDVIYSRTRHSEQVPYITTCQELIYHRPMHLTETHSSGRQKRQKTKPTALLYPVVQDSEDADLLLSSSPLYQY